MLRAQALLWIVLLMTIVPVSLAQESSSFSFQKREQDMDIFVDGQPFATYVWEDAKTTRPYFKQIYGTGGKVQLTRHHPPGPDDFDDHETFHPGIWWGFGDIGGNDYWRLKTKVVGGEFTEQPKSEAIQAQFTVRNRLLDASGKRFCWQTCRYVFVKQRHGILIVCRSTFLNGERDFWLGDQEEMGLAVRVCKSISTKSNSGGAIRDSEGRSERGALRTNQSDWCDYRGPVSGKFGGIMLMNDPANFRKPWWHNADTGLLVANPLGESELSGHGKKRENMLVKKGEPFRLQYGVLVHLHEKESDFMAAQAYADFMKVLHDQEP